MVSPPPDLGSPSAKRSSAEPLKGNPIEVEMGVTQNEGMTILGDLKRKTFIILNLTPYMYIYIIIYIYMVYQFIIS